MAEVNTDPSSTPPGMMPVCMVLCVFALCTLSSCTTDSPTDPGPESTIPPVPVLLTPPDGAIDVPTNTTFSWRPSPGAVSYQLEVGIMERSMFGTEILLRIRTRTHDTMMESGPLAPGTDYFWRVVAMNSKTEARWLNEWNRFRTVTTCASPTIWYAGRTYHTVGLGTQCWLRENLDLGIMIDSMQDGADNGLIEKYCYGNDQNHCREYGGLYQWEEVMQYAPGAGNRGICPPGWHIPARRDIQVLDTAAGISLGPDGFAALMSGIRTTAGNFEGGPGPYAGEPIPSQRAEYWLSEEASADTAYETLLSFFIVERMRSDKADKNTGLAVRCIMD